MALSSWNLQPFSTWNMTNDGWAHEMKTPAQMAEEAIEKRWKISEMPRTKEGYVNTLLIRIGGYRDGYIDGFAASRDQLVGVSKVDNSQRNGDSFNFSKTSKSWISTEDSLPAFYQTVIVASDGGIIDLAHRVDLKGAWAWYHVSRTHYPITHWMPCPQHPRV